MQAAHLLYISDLIPDGCAEDCYSSDIGPDATRLSWAQGNTPYYYEPCSTGTANAPAGYVAQCELFTYAGDKVKSDCGESKCYVDVIVDYQYVYMVDHTIRADPATPTDSTLGFLCEPTCNSFLESESKPIQ